jgi:hypothetical protein
MSDSASVGSASPGTCAEALADLFAAEWEDRLQADPLLATYYGDHRWDDRLPDVSPAAQEERIRRGLS